MKNGDFTGAWDWHTYERGFSYVFSKTSIWDQPKNGGLSNKALLHFLLPNFWHFLMIFQSFSGATLQAENSKAAKVPTCHDINLTFLC